MADRWAEGLEPELLASLRRAATNIRAFHERQREHGFLDVHPDGTVLGQRVLPLRLQELGFEYASIGRPAVRPQQAIAH